MESAIIQAAIAGIVGGVFAGVAAMSAVKIHILYMREHINDIRQSIDKVHARVNDIEKILK